jgi:hypothetical protein
MAVFITVGGLHRIETKLAERTEIILACARPACPGSTNTARPTLNLGTVTGLFLGWRHGLLTAAASIYRSRVLSWATLATVLIAFGLHRARPVSASVHLGPNSMGIVVEDAVVSRRGPDVDRISTGPDPRPWRIGDDGLRRRRSLATNEHPGPASEEQERMAPSACFQAELEFTASQPGTGFRCNCHQHLLGGAAVVASARRLQSRL